MSIRRNTVWNLAGTGLPFLLGVVTIPFLIHRIGIEAFGILTLIWALIGYFSLFDFGLGRALTQQVSASLSSAEAAMVPQLVKSGIIFTCATGVVGGIVLAALSFPLGYTWLKVSAGLQHDAAWCLLVASAGIPLTTVTTGLRGVLEAYEDFKDVNLLRIGLGAANFLLPALSVIFFGPSLTYIVVTLIFARFAVLLAHAWLLHRRLPAWLRCNVEWREIKKLLSFGAWMTVSNIVSPLMVTADRFVIASVLGASAVAYYTVPFEVLIRVLIVPAALTGALFPRMASTFYSDPEGTRKLYKASVKIVTAVLLPLCLAIAVGSFWGLSLWLGKDFAEKSWVVVSILSLGLLLNGIAHVPFAAVQAAGNARITAYIHMIELGAYIPALFAALHFFGIYGAAIVWTLRVGADLLVLLWFAGRYLARPKVLACAA